MSSLLVFSILLLPEVSYASPSNLTEVQKERKQIKEKLSDKELEIAEVLDEIEDLHNELEEIKAALKANEKHMKETEEAITQYEAEIEEIQKEIDRLSVEIYKRNEILKNRIASYQKNGDRKS